MTKKQDNILNSVANKLGVPVKKLWGLIQFESGWNPSAKNPYSSARGLIQFVDKTAQSLGYLNSLDLIIKNPTIESQLLGPVYNYLKKYVPYDTDQALFMAVFYPVAMRWPESKHFPDWVKRVNPGINTPLDYMNKVYNRLNWRYVPRFFIFGLSVVAAYYLLKPKKLRR